MLIDQGKPTSSAVGEAAVMQCLNAYMLLDLAALRCSWAPAPKGWGSSFRYSMARFKDLGLWELGPENKNVFTFKNNRLVSNIIILQLLILVQINLDLYKLLDLRKKNLRETC